MEAWFVLLGAVLLVAFFMARYVITQLGDKEKNIQHIQNIVPGSTQNSMPPPPKETEESRRKYERAQDRDFVLRRKERSPEEADEKESKSKKHKFIGDKHDFKRAILLDEILKRKT